jgi:hypothetical protein
LRRCHLGEDLGGELGPVQPRGWPSATAPPLTLTFCGIEPRLLDHGQGLAGEGLVQLDEVDVGQREARQLQRLGDRLHRADAHDLGGTPATA